MSSRELPEIVASWLGSEPVGEVLRGFPPLSQFICESGSWALLVDCVGSERGAGCTVSSWRRSCCPGGASCFGGLEERRWGRDQQGYDIVDRMTDYFHAHKDATTHDILSHKHAFHVRACEKTVVFMMHTAGVCSVYTTTTIHPTPPHPTPPSVGTSPSGPFWADSKSILHTAEFIYVHYTFLLAQVFSGRFQKQFLTFWLFRTLLKVFSKKKNTFNLLVFPHEV